MGRAERQANITDKRMNVLHLNEQKRKVKTKYPLTYFLCYIIGFTGNKKLVLCIGQVKEIFERKFVIIFLFIN